MARVLEAIRDTGLGLGIAIILPLMVYWGVRVFVERPYWQSDFYDITLDKDLENARIALDNQPDNLELKKQLKTIETKSEQSHAESKKKYSELIAHSDQYLFYANVIVGLSSVVAGGLIPVTSLSIGLIFGGIICVIGGYVMVWTSIAPLIRFLSLFVALLILIGTGYLIARKRRE